MLENPTTTIQSEPLVPSEHQTIQLDDETASKQLAELQAICSSLENSGVDPISILLSGDML